MAIVGVERHISREYQAHLVSFDESKLENFA